MPKICGNRENNLEGQYDIHYKKDFHLRLSMDQKNSKALKEKVLGPHTLQGSLSNPYSPINAFKGFF